MRVKDDDELLANLFSKRCSMKAGSAVILLVENVAKFPL